MSSGLPEARFESNDAVGRGKIQCEREASDVTVCLHFSTQLLRNRIHETTETGMQGASGKYSVLHYIESRFYRITERVYLE